MPSWLTVNDIPLLLQLESWAISNVDVGYGLGLIDKKAKRVISKEHRNTDAGDTCSQYPRNSDSMESRRLSKALNRSRGEGGRISTTVAANT